MKYPTTRKSCIRYAEYLSEIHGRKWIPIEWPDEDAQNAQINFAAVTEYELGEYLLRGWKKIV
jgi:hypothetical protein